MILRRIKRSGTTKSILLELIGGSGTHEGEQSLI